MSGPLLPHVEDPALGTGRVGELDSPVPLGDFARAVAGALPTTVHGVRVAGDLNALVRTVAVVGGAGDSLLQAAHDSGVDVFLTADLRHHPASEAREYANLSDGKPYLVDVSHFASEWLWLQDAADHVAHVHEIETAVSTLTTDPWNARFDAP